MVKEGEKWMCIQTVYMDDSNIVAFRKDTLYKGVDDNALIDESGSHHLVHGDFLEKNFVKENGTKESSGKLNYELDFDFITQMAERMDANKGKYEPYNWQKPIDTKGLHKALARHFFKVMKGEYEDEGREFGHLEALALNAMMITYQLREYSEDNETKKIEKQTINNMELISKFSDHYKAETGEELFEPVILSFFNA